MYFLVSPLAHAQKSRREIIYTSGFYFRINNVSNLQASSDVTTWISNASEKTKNPWIDVLAGVKQNFRTISR